MSPKKLFSVLFLLATCCLPATAQRMQKIEADLDSAYEWIARSTWFSDDRNGKGVIDEDTVADKNEAFQRKLLMYTSKYPATIAWPFNSLKKTITGILTADDGLFRIYNWDDLTGGTMRYYRSVFQFKSGNKVHSCLLPHRDTLTDGGDMGYAFRKLYTLKTGRQVYYLATYIQVGSSRDFGAGIKAFTISNGSLIDTALIIKTKTGMHSELFYGFENNVKSSDHSIYYDSRTKTIFIPVVIEATVTNRYIKYRFNGTCFEKVE